MARRLLKASHSSERTEKISAVLKRFFMDAIQEFDDRTAVEAFKRSRDGAGFGVLFDRYSKRFYGLAHAICRNHARSEDFVQETFRRAIEEIDRFDEGDRKSNFWAWMVTIAERQAIISELREARSRNPSLLSPVHRWVQRSGNRRTHRLPGSTSEDVHPDGCAPSAARVS
jgi:DNA-directed RNA polymerase specialized sigma24 family protein